MVNYDSDSSGGEDNDYTETNVLLGYASSDSNGEEISRLGGRPVCFFLPLIFPNLFVSQILSFSTCRV